MGIPDEGHHLGRPRRLLPALDAKTGQRLWKASVGGRVNAGAMNYSINSKQHVSIAARSAVFTYALPSVGGRRRAVGVVAADSRRNRK